MMGGIRIFLLFVILAVVCSLAFSGCHTPEQSEEALEDIDPTVSQTWQWQPDEQHWVPANPPEGQWRHDLQAFQGWFAGIMIAGGMLGIVASYWMPGVAAPSFTAIGVGMATAGLAQVMDHWLWPYLSISAFLAFAGWRIYLRYRDSAAAYED